MTWKQPQLTDPPMGPTDEIKKLQHRLLLAYNTYSHAVQLGVVESGMFDAATDKALRNIQAHLAATVDPKYNSQPGVLTYDCKVRLGVIVLPPSAPARRFRLQGVQYNANAFLSPDPNHSYVDAINEARAEWLKLALPTPEKKILIGYSMGGDSVNEALWAWPAERRDEIAMAVTFGSPARRPGPTLFGENHDGAGISGKYTPAWAQDRTYDFVIDGDMYPCAVGLLPALYQILIRAKADVTFAMYLFQLLANSVTGGALLGTGGDSSLLGFGSLSSLLGLITPGPTTQIGNGVPDLLSMIANIPEIVVTLIAALKFAFTSAHGHYGDQPQSYWNGLTGVDRAIQLITEKVPNAGVYMFSGTWATWNIGFQADVAFRLP